MEQPESNAVMMSLEELLHRVPQIPGEAIPPLMAQCAALQSALAARLARVPANGPDRNEPPEHNRLLTVSEASAKLGIPKDCLYRRASQLPFTVRLGPRQLRFSSRGIDRYIRQRQGRG